MPNSDRRTLKNVGNDECLCFFVCTVQKYSEGSGGSSEYILRAFKQVFRCPLSEGAVYQRCFVPGTLENIPRFLFSRLLHHIFPGDTFPTHHTCQDSSWERWSRLGVGSIIGAPTLSRTQGHPYVRECTQGPAWISTLFPSKCRTQPVLRTSSTARAVRHSAFCARANIERS